MGHDDLAGDREPEAGSTHRDGAKTYTPGVGFVFETKTTAEGAGETVTIVELTAPS